EYVFHSHQGPGAFEHTEAKTCKGKTAVPGSGKLFVLFAQTGLITGREYIIIIFNVFDQTVIHDADIFVGAVPVPDDTEFILKISGTPRDLGGPAPVLDVMQIAADLLLNIRMISISDQLVKRLPGKFHVIR